MAYIDFTNMAQLESVMNKWVRDGLDSASKIAISKLLDFIQEDVYNRGYSGWYERTEDLLDEKNWSAEIHKGMNGYTLEINPEGVNFTHEVSKLQHTGNKTEINMEQLVSILNDPLLMNFDVNLSYWYNEPKPFWDDFKKWFKENFNEIVFDEIEKQKNK